jgi:hypothetical protein
MDWEIRNTYKVLAGRTDRKRSLGRPRPRWDDDIEDIVWYGVGWIHLAQERDRWRDVVKMATPSRIP